MPAMPKDRPRYVQREKTRHKTMVWYFRRPGGPRVRLPDEYGTEEWWNAYHAAMIGEPVQVASKAASGSLKWLCNRYMRESSAFRSYAETTQRSRRAMLNSVCEKAGDKPFGSITAKTIKQGMERRGGNPANNFLRAMNGLFDWAAHMELVPANPCAEVHKIPVKSEGHHVWTMEEVAQYRERHPLGTKARLAIDLLLFTGLRRSDVVRLGRQHLQGDIIAIRTQKTDDFAYIPIVQPLADALQHAPKDQMTFLVTGYGKPFTAEGFGNWFADQCDAAMLPKQCRAHGLRKAGATMAADAGVSTHQLMAVYGWKSMSQAELYTRSADRKRLARAAAGAMGNDK